MSDVPVTLHGTVFADPTMSQARQSSRRGSRPEERAHFVLVLGRHREVAIVAEEALARHVVAALRAGDPCTVTGFFQDAQWSSSTGHIGREHVLYADSVVRFAPRLKNGAE